ncbi:hypothetical protein D3C77_595790 [compost metagenome]
MLKATEDMRWMSDFYEYIDCLSVQRAFALLIGVFTCSKKVTCGRKAQGEVRTVGLEVNGECWFTIMPAKEWLTFQWRPPATNKDNYNPDKVRAEFPGSFTDTAQAGHWSVKITSIEEALSLLGVLGFD